MAQGDSIASEGKGDYMYVEGRVLTTEGIPIPDAVIETWETDANGIHLVFFQSRVSLVTLARQASMTLSTPAAPRLTVAAAFALVPTARSATAPLSPSRTPSRATYVSSLPPSRSQLTIELSAGPRRRSPPPPRPPQHAP